MKKIILIAGLIGTRAIAGWQDEIGVIPSLSEQMQMAEAISFEQLIDELNNADDFAGTITKVNFRGKEYVIDRRMEKTKRTPGNPPQRETLGSILGGMSATTRGSIKIRVQETFNADGTLATRSWEIDIGGSWEAKTGMEDETGKAHK